MNETTDKPVRVCMLIDGFFPLAGGAETQALQLSQQLIARGARVMVVTRRIDRSFPVLEMIGDLRVNRVAPTGQRTHLVALLTIPLVTWRLLRLRHEYDLLHVHDVRAHMICALLIKLFTRKPIVIKVPANGDVARRVSGTTKLSLYSKLLRRVLLPDALWFRMLRMASAWIAISDEIAHDLHAAGLAQLTHKIANGVDSERFRACATASEREELRRRLGWTSDHRVIVTHGRIVKSKRLDVLIRALGLLKQDFPNLHLCLPGDVYPPANAPKPDLKTLAQTLGLAERVHLPGGVSNPEDYLRAADLFAFPSEREGMPNAVLEAMATGLPIVASRIGGVVDLVDDDSAWLVPPDNPEALAAALTEALQRPEEARRRADRALLNIHNHYTLDAVAQRYLALYRSLI